MTAAGYAGRLSTLHGHLQARVDAARRTERHHRDAKTERERLRAEAELERFMARWGNGHGPDLSA